MEAAAKSKKHKVAAAALAAAMAATAVPAVALTAVNGSAGEPVGVEAAYAATTAQKLSAQAASAASQAPYAAELAKKVAGWDGSSKVKVIESERDSKTLYSDGYDGKGNFSADSGKTVEEVMSGCSGVTANGVRWAFTGGKTWVNDSGETCVEHGHGTLYIDCDGVYDPYAWGGSDGMDQSGYETRVVTSDGDRSVNLMNAAANIVMGSHVTEIAYRAFEEGICTGATLTFEEPSSLVKVASHAFNNSSFGKIVFPASLKTVEKDGIYSGGTAMSGDISFKDPSNTAVDPGAITRPSWMKDNKTTKKMGVVKKVKAGKRSLTVTMKRVTGGKAYRVYYRQAGTTKYKSKLVKKLTKKNSTKSTVTCTIKKLKKGKKYQVHYIAYKKTSAKKASAITRTTDKTSPKVK